MSDLLPLLAIGLFTLVVGWFYCAMEGGLALALALLELEVGK